MSSRSVRSNKSEVAKATPTPKGTGVEAAVATVQTGFVTPPTSTAAKLSVAAKKKKQSIKIPKKIKCPPTPALTSGAASVIPHAIAPANGSYRVMAELASLGVQLAAPSPTALVASRPHVVVNTLKLLGIPGKQGVANTCYLYCKLESPTGKAWSDKVLNDMVKGITPNAVAQFGLTEKPMTLCIKNEAQFSGGYPIRVYPIGLTRSGGLDAVTEAYKTFGLGIAQTLSAQPNMERCSVTFNPHKDLSFGVHSQWIGDARAFDLLQKNHGPSINTDFDDNNPGILALYWEMGDVPLNVASKVGADVRSVRLSERPAIPELNQDAQDEDVVDYSDADTGDLP